MQEVFALELATAVFVDEHAMNVSMLSMIYAQVLQAAFVCELDFFTTTLFDCRGNI